MSKRKKKSEQREAMDASSSIARQSWELENNIVPMEHAASGSSSPSRLGTSSSAPAAAAVDSCDSIYAYDEAAQSAIQQQKPWTRDPHYFKNVKISALALLKMVVHARSGGTLEVMGIMQGKIEGDTFIVMDAFALPVEGTETRVNAQADAYEYMVDYVQTNKQIGRLENVVGWYHSHPGYGCWLSGIDVTTQVLNQQYQEPFLAVVIDPTRTVSAGKVEIGAFRTYPQGYKPPDEPASEYQTIPLNKIEDFGVHCKQYYPLDITYFKSSLDSHLLDLLWNKYWLNTLSSSPLLGSRDYVAGQISDLAEKLEQTETQLAHSGRMGGFFMPSQKKKEVSLFVETKKRLESTIYVCFYQEESQLAKITKDSSKITVEQVHGLMSQVIKDILFNSVTPVATAPSFDSSGPEPMAEA
ncbi:COP9 signalosome complex subunit 5a isoform X1 [Selaginella moellendorffii]|uniref:COP9 signalosome complex subunit 5a isoform X1 n=1 Tax=Selaginella moellendorffii TaxID=88036 RepID=UPI000D1C8E92|nr:COP9 signalosome complex subunit 5a isoform X1 [Selaginella moellendorffii]|eukprot:XP_024532465.1 COP9 signalosome complex subunit 5a isoform X1 [Selaginella moellendorffii]